MKKRIRSLLAALVCGGLLLVLSPNLFRDSGFTWIKWDAITGPHNYYFAKRQWLADARTIAAAVRYLYESSTYSRTNPIEVVNVPRPVPLRPISTNFIGIARPGHVASVVQGA